MKSKTGEDLVFAVFNTPENSIVGSGVCSYSMSDIRDSFNGSFKVQHDVNSNWLPLPRQREPRTRPGQCHVNSRHLDDEHLNFLKENVLMDQAVSSLANVPHFIKTSPHERLTAIGVDPSITTTNGEVVDVIFVGTTRGRVLKLVSGQHGTTLIEEIQIFPLHVPVSNILVLQQSSDKSSSDRVVVLSEHEVKSFPKSRCKTGLIVTCGDCVGTQDPYCAWSVTSQRCETVFKSKDGFSSLLQNIGAGHHSGCPSVSRDNAVFLVNHYQIFDNTVRAGNTYFQEIFPRRLSDDDKGPERVFSEKTLALACSSAAFIALLVGFLSGFCFSRKCQSDESYLKCGHSYLESNGVKWYPDDKGCYVDSGYNTTNSTTKNNLLINLPEKKDPHKNNIPITKNKVILKCKKIYL